MANVINSRMHQLELINSKSIMAKIKLRIMCSKQAGVCTVQDTSRMLCTRYATVNRSDVVQIRLC